MLSFLLFAFLDAEGMSVFVGLCVGFVVFLAVLYAVSYWFLQDKGECTDRPDMTGKVCVVTGTTRGLGRVAARRLASCGATVVMLNRNEQAGKETAAAITSETGNKEVFNVPCDLADLAAVKTASEAVLARWPEIDVLLCNAGILTTELTPTAQGFEPHYGVNFLSHFVLVNNLLPALQKRPEARLVMLSSCGQWFTFGMDFSRLTVEDYTSHNWRYDHFFSYCRSKLAMLLFAKECQRRYGNANLVSVAAAPGVIMTDLWRKISPAVDFFLRYIAFVPLCAFCCDPFHVCVFFCLAGTLSSRPSSRGHSRRSCAVWRRSRASSRAHTTTTVARPLRTRRPATSTWPTSSGAPPLRSRVTTCSTRSLPTRLSSDRACFLTDESSTAAACYLSLLPCFSPQPFGQASPQHCVRACAHVDGG